MSENGKKPSINEQLASFRESIDRVDGQILDLLNERAKIAQEVGRVKNNHDTEFYIPAREKAVIQRLRDINPGPLPSEAVGAIFREVISACRSLETRLTITYLGPEGSFHHCASKAHFGSSSRFFPVDTIKAVFHEVECQRADYGVVAIENSVEGSVGETLDRLVHYKIHIVGELFLPISHNLISQSELHDIQQVYSHPQALAQCRNWLEANLPNAKAIDASSTTAGVKRCQNEPKSAAIASSLAAEIYDVPIQVREVEDFAGNTTRFFIISTNPSPPSQDDKTSLAVFLRDKIGALHSMLEPFKTENINLTNIVSRPTKEEAWQYMFFLECDGHFQDEKVIKAIRQIESHSLYVKVLGSYPNIHFTSKAS